MKKIVLSLILLFGILSCRNLFAQYEIVDSQYFEEDEFYSNLKFNTKILNKEDLNKELEKFGIDKNKCKKSSTYYKKNGITIITCGLKKKNYVYYDWDIYINGVKVKANVGLNGPSISNIEFVGNKIRIDQVISYSVSAGHIYTLKDVSTKEELIKNSLMIKKSLNGTRYYTSLKKIDLIISKLDDNKLKELNSKILELKDKYKNNSNIRKILIYIRNLIKIKTKDYNYEYSFHQNNFNLNIKNDINNNKILFGKVLDKNIKNISIYGFDKISYVEIKDGSWEFNTGETFIDDYYYVSYYDKKGNFYYSESIYSGKNIDKNNFKLGIKNDKEFNKVLFGEVLDKNVKSITIENDKIKVKDFSLGKWEQNTYLKYGKQSYDVKYYDKNGKLYYMQEIYID